MYNFTATLDVIGHEMTHAVTQFNSQLQYLAESGALNEHISDVFGIMVKQWADQEDVGACLHMPRTNPTIYPYAITDIVYYRSQRPTGSSAKAASSPASRASHYAT